LLVTQVSYIQDPPVSISSATFDGNAMTQAVKETLYSGDTEYITELYYIANPGTGSATVSITFSTNANWCSGAASFFNVDIEDPLDNTAKATAAVGGTSTSITVVENALIVDGIAHAAAVERAPGGSQTLIYSDTIVVGNSGGSSYRLASAAGSYSMDWTGSTGDGWSHCLASFKPALQTGGGFIFNLL